MTTSFTPVHYCQNQKIKHSIKYTFVGNSLNDKRPVLLRKLLLGIIYQSTCQMLAMTPKEKAIGLWSCQACSWCKGRFFADPLCRSAPMKVFGLSGHFRKPYHILLDIYWWRRWWYYFQCHCCSLLWRRRPWWCSTIHQCIWEYFCVSANR